VLVVFAPRRNHDADRNLPDVGDENVHAARRESRARLRRCVEGARGARNDVLFEQGTRQTTPQGAESKNGTGLARWDPLAWGLRCFLRAERALLL
jgi:hypothetical protein